LVPCWGWASCWSGARSPRAPLAVLHGRNEEAEELLDEIEREVEEETGQPLEEVGDSIRIRQRKSIGFGVIAPTAFKRYPKRTLLGLSLFIGQAPAHDHPLLCGLWGAADRHRAAVQRRGAVGRHPDRLLGGGLLLRLGRGQRRLPDRQRDLPAGDQGDGLAFFYAVGTGVGGVTGPLLFGKLVGTEQAVNVFYGYLLGAVLMIAAGTAEWSSGSRRPASPWRTWPAP
jgi:hypothetical protein